MKAKIENKEMILTPESEQEHRDAEQWMLSGCPLLIKSPEPPKEPEMVQNEPLRRFKEGQRVRVIGSHARAGQVGTITDRLPDYEYKVLLDNMAYPITLHSDQLTGRV